jgi:tRNA uridine 5-carboxymethylaminomethyl modification enzyme
LREDNADARLTEIGRGLGLVDDARWDAFCRKRDAVSRETERLRGLWISPKSVSASEAVRVFGKALEHEYQMFELLRRPDVSYGALMSLDGGRFQSPELPVVSPVSRETLAENDGASDGFVDVVVDQVEIAAKYAGYIGRQKEEIERAAHYENLHLPADLDYMQVTALSVEARQRLNTYRPETLGLASRMTGITPASISLLLVHLKKGRFREFSRAEQSNATPNLADEAGVQR